MDRLPGQSLLQPPSSTWHRYSRLPCPAVSTERHSSITFLNTLNEMNLTDDGIEFHHDFLSNDELAALRAEVDFLFSKSTNAGPGFSVYLSPYVQELSWPASKIKSINLLDRATRILRLLDSTPETRGQNFRLAHIAVYREQSNPKPLHWHSDGRKGHLVRAQVCIRGGMADSGSFQFVRSSHKLPEVDYLPQPGWVEQNSHLIQSCAEPNGTLYLFNTLGYHNKTVCLNERISIMFDFLSESYLQEGHDDVCSDLIVSINDLSPEVIANLPRLQVELNRSQPSANTADAYRFKLSWGGMKRRIDPRGRAKAVLKKLRG